MDSSQSKSTKRYSRYIYIYMQHLEHMCEDKTFSSEDRSKFKGWIRKWTDARLPLLVALFIEVLSPAKLLSKCFQDDSIDVVGSVASIKRIKEQLQRIEIKPFEELPTVTHIGQDKTT